ncbi:MAG: UPF0149 family protein [Pseudomonadota bacterium]
MPAPAPIDAAGLERLAELLDRRAVPFGGLNLEALDGYLSAVMVSPAVVMPSEWQPGIFGPKPPRWDGADEANEIQTLLLGFWNLISERVRQEAPDRHDLLPMIWLPVDDDDAVDPDGDGAPPSKEDAAGDEDDFGADWALGFLRAVEMRKPQWDAWFEDEEWILDGIFDIISLLNGEQRFDADGAALDEARPLSIEERKEIIADLPWLLIDLHHHRIEALTPRTPIRRETTAGRNDPCPCGSGKKFKKCCGA